MVRPDFSLCGWRFRSAIDLEGLPHWPAESDAPVDIELVLGPVAEVDCADPIGVVLGQDGVATVVAVDAGRFSVRDGKTIVADIKPDALPGVVETISLGPVLGALSYQRGLLPLHSNTILIDGYAVALSGRSGAGKSTLAAVLMQRGHRLISDDVLPVAKSAEVSWALPGNQNIRLWRETLEHLGHRSQGLRRAADGDRDKYFLPQTTDKISAPKPLAAVIWLEREVVETEALQLHTGMLRARTILKASYRRHLANEYATRGHASIVDLSMPGVDVYNFLRPRGFERLERQAEMIESLVAARA